LGKKTNSDVTSEFVLSDEKGCYLLFLRRVAFFAAFLAVFLEALFLFLAGIGFQLHLQVLYYLFLNSIDFQKI